MEGLEEFVWLALPGLVTLLVVLLSVILVCVVAIFRAQYVHAHAQPGVLPVYSSQNPVSDRMLTEYRGLCRCDKLIADLKAFFPNVFSSEDIGEIHGYLNFIAQDIHLFLAKMPIRIHLSETCPCDHVRPGQGFLMMMPHDFEEGVIKYQTLFTLPVEACVGSLEAIQAEEETVFEPLGQSSCSQSRCSSQKLIVACPDSRTDDIYQVIVFVPKYVVRTRRY